MKYIIVLVLLFIGFIGVSQNLSYRVGGKITNSDTKKNEAGVTISFTSGGKVLSSVVTSSNGKYDLKVDAPMGRLFMITYSKPGFVTKKIKFDGSKMNAEDIPAGVDFPLPTLDMDLFTDRAHADFSFLENEPVASFFWSETQMMLDYDKESSARIRKKIEDLLAKQAKEEQQREASYQAAINAGQSLYYQKKYQEALAKYTEASKLKPNEQLPISQIDAIDKLLLEQKNAAAASNKLDTEYKNLILAGDNLRNQKKYQDAILKYQEALTKKQELYPKTEIAKLNDLIKKENEEKSKQADFEKYKSAGLALANQKKWEEAKAQLSLALKVKDDAGVSAKIKEIDTEILKDKGNAETKAKYDQAITEAQGLMTSKKYLDAKEKFKLALGIDPTQQLPKQKIAELEGLILKQQKESELAAKIEKFMSEGNGFLVKKDYNNAKLKFEEVLKLEPSNSSASERLKLINSELNALKGEVEKEKLFNQLKKDGFALAANKKYQEAKLKLEDALDIKSDASINQKLIEINNAIELENKSKGIEEQYNTFMEQGSKEELNKNYELAISKYKSALNLKPNELKPKEKITSLEKLLKDQENASQKEAEKEKLYNSYISNGASKLNLKNYDGAIEDYNRALGLKPGDTFATSKIEEANRLKAQANDSKEEAEKNKLYNTHISKGDNQLKIKDYDGAITEYKNALEVKPGDSYANSKISEAKQLKDNLLKAEGAANANKAEFDKFMLEADKLFKQKRYLDAKTKYESALSITPSGQKARLQIKECIRLEQAKSDAEEDAGYQKLLAAADKKMKAKDYTKAKEYYERALAIKSTDPYPRVKLDEIDRVLNPKAKPIVQKPELKLEPEKLQPLGEPYSKSIMDGQEDLKRAEFDRKKLQKKKLENGVNNVNDKSEEFTNQKKAEREVATSDVFNVQMSIEEENSEKGKEFQSVIENNKNVRRQQEEDTYQSNVYENTDRLNIQEKTDIIKLENDFENSEKIVEYLEKGNELKSHNTEYSNNSDISFLDKKATNMEAQSGIVDVENKIIEKQEDDKESRIEVEERIKSDIKKAYKKAADDVAKEHLEVKQMKKQIHDAESKMGEKALNDASNASVVNVDLREIKSKVIQSTTNSINHASDQGKITTSNIVDLNSKIENEKLSNDDNLIYSSSTLRNNSKDLYNSSNDTYNNEKQKNILAKGNIHKKLNKIEETTTTSNDKLIESNTNIKNQTKDLIDGNNQQKLENDKKLLSSQQIINNTSNKGDSKQVIVPNALGEEYPEGVSQESFTQNDENGLMKAIITRRIVVIEGRGDVYVRTQTTSATTYSKNGDPSSERTWQKETQGPHLIKNY
jgi:epidermal growth factor receptor substrate 15